MSAEAVEPSRPRSFNEASPSEVMAALVPEERPDFEQQWRRAMADAIDSLDLTEVYTILDSWRRRATITNYLGHNGYREMLARADRILRTGEPEPGSVPLDEIKALLAERLGQ